MNSIPYFQVSPEDKTEVLCDGKFFAKTGSHVDSIRIVMAMGVVYKQIQQRKDDLVTV